MLQMIQLFKYVGKEEGSRKGSKREGDPKWGAGVTYHFNKRENVIREPEVNTPQNQDRTTNPTIMDYDKAFSTIKLQINRI